MADNNGHLPVERSDVDADGDDNGCSADDNDEHTSSSSFCSNRMIDGSAIADILHSEGPVVTCVVLRAPTRRGSSKRDDADDHDHDADETDTTNDRGKEEGSEQQQHLEDLVEELEIDTTPQKNEVEKILGGPITFLGQYENESIVLMVKRGCIQTVMTTTEEDDDNTACEEEKQKEKEEPQQQQQQKDYGNVEEENDESKSKAITATTTTTNNNNNNNNNKCDFSKMTIRQLRAQCLEWCVDMDGVVEKGELVEALKRKEESLPLINPHKLQPPLHNIRVRGDILILKVAEVDDYDDDDEVNGNDEENIIQQEAKGKETGGKKEEKGGRDDNWGDSTSKQDGGVAPSNLAAGAAAVESSDFFLPYTKKQYLAFAARTDIAIEPLTTTTTTNNDNNEKMDDDDGDDDEDGGDDDDDENDEDFNPEEEMTEEEEKSAMLNIVMNELLRKFRNDNGRGPDSQEVLEIRASVAEQIGLNVVTYDESQEAAEHAAQAQMKNGKKKRAADAEGNTTDMGDDGKAAGRSPPRKRVKFDSNSA